MPSGTINGSTGNQYIDSKIEWSYTQNTAGNTSTVTAALYYKRNNTGFTTYGTGTFSITIGGKTTSATKFLSITGSGWVKAVEATETISHNSDGSKSVAISTSGSIPSTSLTSTSCSGTVKLNTIPRASTITSAYAVTLGNSCKVMFTPASSTFWYKLVFSLGSWKTTTEAFRPGTTSPYTYTGCTIPLDVASNFPNTTSGTVTATLYTFESENAQARIGSTSSANFTVTLPNNTSTKPSIAMALAPVTPYSKFSSLFLQGKSKVQATFSGSGKFGATIASHSLKVEGRQYSAPYLSDMLSSSGTVSVVGTVIDSRGFANTVTQTINVLAYEAPYISPSSGYKKVICERCTEDGTASETGTYLHVKGKRNYTKINTNGITNTCSVRCRYKAEGGAWSHGSGAGVPVLLWTDTTTDEFDIVLSDVSLDTKLAYAVELNTIDDTYLPSYIEVRIPSEAVDFELREGGKGAAFGKHATEENLLDCEWDAKFNEVTYLNSLYLIEKEITVDGDKDTYYPVHIQPVLLEKYTSINTQPAFLGLGKILNSKAGDWEGNHSTANSSSISAGWLYRYSGWDGNGDYIIPLYKREPFAKILAHIQGLNQAAKGVVLYLRGGGATYKIACSIPFNPHVYLAETNVSESSDPTLYPVMLTPRGYEGNKGINFSNGIASDFVVEQAQTSTWYYRKWYSGMAECWYRRNVDVNINTAWGSALYYGVASTINYPFTFSEKPICQITCEYGDDATSLFIASCGSGTNVYATPVMLCRTDSKNVNCNILYHVHGRWR